MPEVSRRTLMKVTGAIGASMLPTAVGPTLRRHRNTKNTMPLRPIPLRTPQLLQGHQRNPRCICS